VQQITEVPAANHESAAEADSKVLLGDSDAGAVARVETRASQ